MGSATREALATAREALAATSGKISLATGEQLLAAGRVIGESAQLRSAFADPAAEPEAKAALAAGLFTSVDAKAKALLGGIVSSRWSNEDELLAGIEEIGIRAIAQSAPASVSIESELFTFGQAVAADPALELAVGSKLGSAEAKASLVTSLLGKNASAQTVAIVQHLVQQPRGRRIAELLTSATAFVADQAGLSVATVTTARPIAAAQLARLQKGLAKTYGRELHINQVVDPAVIGGLRVQIGDDVIDGSVATKINDLRLQLAG